MTELKNLSMTELEEGLEEIRRSPANEGTIEMIVVRPAVDLREIVSEARIDGVVGVVGDTWSERQSSSTPDGSPNPEKQVILINTRAIDLIAQERERWALAGDQLYIDLDMSEENLPAGSRIAVGSAVLEVSAQPHLGCAKFTARFGLDAMRFVNSPVGRQLRLRGVNTKVVEPGVVRVGDIAVKL